MATSEDAGEQPPIPFKVERSDLAVQVTFRSRLWSLFHDITKLYDALLDLSEFGVTAQGIKSDVADGSLGAYNVNFWMLDFRVLVRIRLERLDIQFNGMVQGDLERFEQAFLRLLGALSTARSDFAVAGYGIDLGLHGETVGVESGEYLSRFVRNIPRVGPHLTSGVIFYYGEGGASTLRTLTLEMSGSFPGRLFFKHYALFNDSVRPDTLRRVFEEQVMTALRLVGLSSESS
jgi:hypothetical protein